MSSRLRWGLALGGLILALGLGGSVLSGFDRGPTPTPTPTPPSPVAEEGPARRSVSAPPPDPLDRVRPTVTEGIERAAAEGLEPEGLVVDPEDVPVRGVRAGEPPTLEDVEVAYATFDKISLLPETPEDDPDVWDREAAVRLRYKTVALQKLVDQVDAGMEAGTVDRSAGRRVLERTRQKVVDTMADVPVPSYVEDDEAAEAWRLQVTEQALAVIDPLSPEEMEE